MEADSRAVEGKWLVAASPMGGIMASMEGLRVVFMGTPGFVVPVADAVAGLGGEIIAVYTSPDKPAGRGRKIRPSPVKEWALERGLPVFTPAKLAAADEQQRFVDLGAEIVVLAAYGLLLPKVFLVSPRHGAVNVHPSLLPRHRGAAPVAAAILAGDSVTGATIMVMDEGLDTGPVVAQASVPLQGNERTPALTEQLFRLGADLLVEHLPRYLRGEVQPRPQSEEGASLAKRFTKEDGVLDWGRPAVELERRVRAFDPWPGSVTTWRGKRLEVLEAEVAETAGAEDPGTVVSVGNAAGVVTSAGVLVLRRLKLEGRPATGIQEFLHGHGALIGSRLPS